MDERLTDAGMTEEESELIVRENNERRAYQSGYCEPRMDCGRVYWQTPAPMQRCGVRCCHEPLVISYSGEEQAYRKKCVNPLCLREGPASRTYHECLNKPPSMPYRDFVANDASVCYGECSIPVHRGAYQEVLDTICRQDHSGEICFENNPVDGEEGFALFMSAWFREYFFWRFARLTGRWGHVEKGLSHAHYDEFEHRYQVIRKYIGCWVPVAGSQYSTYELRGVKSVTLLPESTLSVNEGMLRNSVEKCGCKYNKNSDGEYEWRTWTTYLGGEYARK